MLTKKQIEKKGYKVSFTNGSGAGGQKRNRTYSVAIVEHLETGITQRNDETRKAAKNMNIAYNIIEQKIKENTKTTLENRINDARGKSLGKGVIRTYDFKRGLAKNHLNGKQANLKDVLNGGLDLLY